ncbi:MAG: NHL repeat-containing protein [Planctomycetaceae bacterium]
MKTHAAAVAIITLAMLARTPSANAQSAEMQYPLSAVATEDGTIYIADRNWPGVWKFADGKLEPFFQASKKFRTPLNAVRCVALDEQGRVLAGDSATREVYRFDEQGRPQPLTGGKIGIPMDIAVDSEGRIYVADLELHRIWRVPAEGGEPQEVALVAAPRGLAFDAEGRLLVVSHGENQVVRLSPEGNIETVVEGRPFRFPHDLVATDGTLYIVDGYAKAVWKVEAGGEPSQWVSGGPLVNPTDVFFRDDALLIVDPRANAVFETAADGALKRLIPTE